MDLENLFRENFEEELLCRFIVRGKKDERYILCKTDSGIRLIPYTVNKDRVFSADCENSVFLAEEDIKKVSLVKSDLVYKIKIRQEDGKTFKLKASRKVKADASHKENVKKFRKIYKKTCRRAQNLERLEIVIGIILAVVIGSHAFIYSFTHFAPKNIDGNELIEYAKSEGKDQMFMSPDMYNKTDLKLSGETQNYENAVYSLESACRYENERRVSELRFQRWVHFAR